MVFFMVLKKREKGPGRKRYRRGFMNAFYRAKITSQALSAWKSWKMSILLYMTALKLG